jgi:hypothetical protein
MHAKPYYQSLLLMLLLSLGFWWGEGGGGIGALMQACIAAMIVSAVVFFIKMKLAFKALAYLCLSIVLMSAFLFGQASNGRAFNECVAHRGEVRALLQAYFQEHQHYPPTLSALNLAVSSAASSKVPCNRILRSSILNYQLTKQGYQLYFSDAFVSFTATESQPFDAHK